VWCFISSICVGQKALKGCASMPSSKAAFEAIVRWRNMDWRTREVRINIVRPGVTAAEIQNLKPA